MAYYEYCLEHNGIEIYFEERPDEEYLESLRENGWKWHKKKKCWYNYASDDNEEFAEEICDSFNEEYGYDDEEDEDEEEEYEYDVPVKSPRVITGNLIRCVDCGKNISSRASFCVNCGAPMDYIKEEYEKERIRQVKIKEKEAKEKAEKARRKEEDERKREIERILAEVERIRKEEESKKLEEEERKKAEREKKAKEKRIKDLEALYIKDKSSFVERICNKRVFNKLECYVYTNGYKWELSNKDEVVIEYDDRTREMKIKYSEQNVQKISDAKIKEKICSFQKNRKEMEGIEKEIQERKRQEMLREMEEERERAIRNGEYHNYGPVYTDSSGFVISKPYYKK